MSDLKQKIMESGENNNNLNSGNLEVTNEAKNYLRETAKWAKFLAIVGFVFTGILIFFGVFLGVFLGVFMNKLAPDFEDVGPLEGFMGAGLSFVYLLIALLYFYLLTKLYLFAVHTNKALAAEDSHMLANAFKAQNAMFKFIGIFTIVVISLYGVMIIVFGSVALGSFFQ